MYQLFNDNDSQAVLLVDATNAFNTLYSQVALLNINSLFPPLANTYRFDVQKNHWSDVQLYIDGETLLL